jgi:hypothetical protein
MAANEATAAAVTCKGVSPWNEACNLRASCQCEECGEWFCEAHFDDPDWHECEA